MKTLNEYLEKNWDLCTRECREDDGNLIGLPYPYTVPSPETFNELYYWDTYFTNIGLLKSGHASLAKSNTDNMLYLVNRYGFMPNGNRTYYLSRSQPPFLSEMVRDIYNYYGDNVWLEGAYSALEKEYEFWTTKRLAPNGLSIYDGTFEGRSIDSYASGFINRIGFTPENADELDLARHHFSGCESGWDMSPRFDFEQYNFAPVDLNSLLYLLETNMAYFAEKLGKEDVWSKRAKKRREIMFECMLDDNNIFLDYNFEKDTLSKVFSVASFYPLFAKAATKEQAEAAAKNLHRLESNYGILTCEKNDFPGTYQWDYPNGWACLQYIVVKGLLNYGYDDDAERIARKYVSLVEKVFEQTGNLWEKYNVIEGNINVSNEYKMPAMMGWSAGVYIALKNLLGE